MMACPASPTWPTAAQRARCRGASLFELLIVALIIALLVGVSLNRIAWYQRQVELAGVQQLVLALRAALQLQTAALLTRDGGAQALTELAGKNPMDWLAKKPINYAGEYYSPKINELQPGTWCFDRTNKILIYLLGDEKNVANSVDKTIKYKVKLFKAISEPVKLKVPDKIVLEQITG